MMRKSHFIYSALLFALLATTPAAAYAQEVPEDQENEINTPVAEAPLSEASAFQVKQTGSEYTVTVSLLNLAVLRAQSPGGGYFVDTGAVSFTLPYQIVQNQSLTDYLAQEDLDAEALSLRVTIMTLSNPDTATLTSAYQARFPQGRLAGTPYRLTLSLCDDAGESIGFELTQLDAPLDITLATTERANAAFLYDQTNGQLSFVPALTEVNSLQLTTSSLGIIVSGKNTAAFADTTSHWAETQILIAARKGLVTGTGEDLYEPNRNITRAEFCRLIFQALSLPASEQPVAITGYSDVTTDAWHYDTIMNLKAIGILDVFPAGNFSPNQDITREEMAAILAGALDYLHVSAESTSADLASRFADAGSIATNYQNGVKKVVSLGVMNGMTDTAFEPQGNATRAQAAVAVTGMLRSFGLIDAINYDFESSALYSTGAVLLEWESQTELLSKNQDVQVYPASLTKLMTGLIILEHWDQVPETITLDGALISELKSKSSSMAGFAAGETVPKEDLLYGTMLMSGGECAHALARIIGGSDAGFVALMNEKAQELGLSSTNFMNPTGLHHSQHYTTIRDLKALFLHTLENQQFYDIVTTRYYTTTATGAHPQGLNFENGIFGRFEGSSFTWGTVLGGKTGYTGQAGQCLASIVEKNGVKYLMITTGNGVDAPGVRYYTADVATVYTQFILR